MSKQVAIAFECTGVTLSLDALQPIRQTQLAGPSDRYYKVVASLRAMKGVLVEPLIVYPVKGATGQYILLDGHWRLKALKELGYTEAFCLIAKDDEAFTYNHQVNHLAPIQENAMILRVLDQGVSEEQIAEALNVKVEKIRASRDLLVGIDPAAVHVLRAKQISAGALKVFKKVKAGRQIKMAELMVMTGNYSKVFAETLFASTDKKELLFPDVPKKIRTLKLEEIERLEAEMGSMERNFKLAEHDYSANVLQLSVASRYIERLVGNQRITKYLAQHHADVFNELSHVIEDRSLASV